MHVLKFRAVRKCAWGDACNLWSNAEALHFTSKILWYLRRRGVFFASAGPEDQPARVEVEACILNRSRRFARVGPDALERVAIVQIKRMSRVIARDSHVARDSRACNLKPQTGWVEIVSGSKSCEHMAHRCRVRDSERHTTIFPPSSRPLHGDGQCRGHLADYACLRRPGD